MRKTDKMTRADPEAYRARWQRVNEDQTEELRRASLGHNLRQAALLFRL